MTYVTSVTSKGQATIPAPIRKELGIKPGDKIVFSHVKGEARIKPALSIDSLMGSVKSNRRFSQKLLREEEEAIGKYIVEQYLEKEKRIRDQQSEK